MQTEMLRIALPRTCYPRRGSRIHRARSIFHFRKDSLADWRARQPATRRLLLTGTGVALVLGVGWLGSFEGSFRPAPEVLFRSNRLLYPRLSFPQAYEPCEPESEQGLVPGMDCQRSSRPFASEARAALRVAQDARATTEPGATSGADPRHALLRLAVEGRGGPSSRLVEWLEREAIRTPSADRWIDLSAAWYVVATTEDQPALLAKGLAAAEKALEMEPDRAEAQFNRALLLEALWATEAARQAWESYLGAEAPGSPWRQDAERHLEELSRPLVAERWLEVRRELEAEEGPLSPAQVDDAVGEFARPVRDWIEHGLLPGWAAAWLRGDEIRAAAALERAAQLSETLALRTGEELPRAVVLAVQAALDSRRRRQVELMARSIVDAQEGRETYLRGEPETALVALRRAIAGLDESSPLALWPRFFIAAGTDLQGDKRRAEDQLLALASDIETSSYRTLAARVDALLGRIRNNTGRPEAAIPGLRHAIAELEAVGDDENGAYAETLLAESFHLLGDVESAWEHFYRALKKVRPLGTPHRELQALNVVASFARRIGDERLSCRYQDAAVSIGPRLGNPAYFADVLLWRSLLKYRQGDATGAAEDLERAEEESRKIQDPKIAARFSAELNLAQGIMLRESSPALAAEALSSAISYFSDLRLWSRLVLSHEARASARRLLGEREAEQEDLRRALELRESLGGRLADDAFRISFAGAVETASDQLLREMLASPLDAHRLLEHVERERALNHPTRLGERWSTAAEPIAAIQSALPPHTALVEYAILPDRLLTWLVTGTAVDLFETPVTAAELESLVVAFTTTNGEPPGRQASAERLGELLLGSVVPELLQEGVEALVIVPDDLLFRVPFAALSVPAEGTLLVEHWALGMSPSATLFVRGARRLHALAVAGQEEHGLVVADPEIDREIWPSVPALPEARREGEVIAERLGGASTLLAGAAATVEALREGVGAATWLHFAGHAVALPARPLDSYLLLAPSPGRSGRLPAHELAEWDLSRLRAVVLAACGSAASPTDAWPAAVSVARPFLTAGVPIVIGTLRPVSDQNSRRFFGRFYDHLAGHGSAFRAFHQAQLELLRDAGAGGASEGGWSSFVLFGGPDWAAGPSGGG